MASAKNSKKVTGKLLFNRRGGGARIIGPDDKLIAWVDAEGTAQAIHGDTVEAVMVRHDAARVSKLLQRRETIVGTYQRDRKYSFVVPDEPRIACNILVRAGGPKLSRPPRAGDKVVIKLETSNDPRVSPAGHLVELLGAPGDAGVDMLSVIRTYELQEAFPDAVEREAAEFDEQIPEDELAKRQDCRKDFVLTIDPDDAKDHDDAIHVQKLRNGWLLSVHIADVAHFVRPGTALDKEARRRGNSTYLADRCIPMLPFRLSADICSLREGVDRLAHSAFIEFSREGKPRRVRFAKTVIRVAKRLTYKQAKRLLDSGAQEHMRGETAEIATALHEAWGLASVLRKQRFAAGSLDLDFPEVKVKLDAEGRVDRIERVENDESHQLVEEFMLAANEAVAHAIKNRPAPCVYRVHEKPDADRLNEFRELAATQGFRVGDLKNRKEVQRMLSLLRGRADEHRLKVEFLKSLRRAAYSPDPLGHYGLAKPDYLHFTSPIRRYADLIAHRALAHERVGGRKELADVSQHISDTERNSAAAEQESVLVKKLEYFLRQVESKKPHTYEAIITEVKPHGLLVEVPGADVFGLVHVASLPGGPYEYDRMRAQLFHRRSGRGYKAGATLKVRACRVDAEQRQIDFSAV